MSPSLGRMLDWMSCRDLFQTKQFWYTSTATSPLPGFLSQGSMERSNYGKTGEEFLCVRSKEKASLGRAVWRFLLPTCLMQALQWGKFSQFFLTYCFIVQSPLERRHSPTHVTSVEDKVPLVDYDVHAMMIPDNGSCSESLSLLPTSSDCNSYEALISRNRFFFFLVLPVPGYMQELCKWVTLIKRNEWITEMKWLITLKMWNCLGGTDIMSLYVMYPYMRLLSRGRKYWLCISKWRKQCLVWFKHSWKELKRKTRVSTCGILSYFL